VSGGAPQFETYSIAASNVDEALLNININVVDTTIQCIPHAATINDSHWKWAIHPKQWWQSKWIKIVDVWNVPNLSIGLNPIDMQSPWQPSGSHSIPSSGWERKRFEIAIDIKGERQNKKRFTFGQ
jgi:hypothetical protein